MKNEAGIFKALADETLAALDLPQSTVSRHLAYLKRTGWVRDRKQGVWMYYRLDEKDVLIRELQAVLEKNLAGNWVHALALERLRAFQKQQDQQVC